MHIDCRSEPYSLFINNQKISAKKIILSDLDPLYLPTDILNPDVSFLALFWELNSNSMDGLGIQGPVLLFQYPCTSGILLCILYGLFCTV